MRQSRRALFPLHPVQLRQGIAQAPDETHQEQTGDQHAQAVMPGRRAVIPRIVIIEPDHIQTQGKLPEHQQRQQPVQQYGNEAVASGGIAPAHACSADSGAIRIHPGAADCPPCVSRRSRPVAGAYRLSGNPAACIHGETDETNIVAHPFCSCPFSASDISPRRARPG